MHEKYQTDRGDEVGDYRYRRLVLPERLRYTLRLAVACTFA